MSEIRLNIDGREVVGFEGQTILEIAASAGIEIPTLCHDKRVEVFGSCGVCVVELHGSPKLPRACSTMAADKMIVYTQSERVRAVRKSALELLLSDHRGDCRPPCMLACPAQTDCQGYVGLIANGQYTEALKLIKDKIPFPASIGRVCPHPCEDACRREMVEEPIAIAALKQFAGDLDITSGGLYTPQIGEPTGKVVAVIGGGPGGLSAAYFLRAQGHEVAIYDAMPEMGGMLRYGIPEYRLPKKLLDAEIAGIEGMGVRMLGNIKVGRDITLDYLRNTYDAVVVAIGAWSSSGLGCPGENLEGVVGGIDFLRDVTLNSHILAGQKIGVVGGGNTAMDACRTAVRLGASEVYNIYRRTRNEMPAQDIEIIEAEEEGVIFKNLTNPIEVIGEGGRVKAVRLQVMELGEPDASGRRRPVAISGKEEVIDIDTLIVAIGQKPKLDGFEGLETTKWGTVVADIGSFTTNLPGVFAIGDLTNDGADIAITAIGEAQKAAVMVGRYLEGEPLGHTQPYLVAEEKTPEDFARQEKLPRVKVPHRSPEIRRKDFLEVNLPLGETEAVREAGRCLECGCHDFFECKLIDLATRYDARPEKYEGKANHNPIDNEHPFIAQNPDKCILCGLCVRICDETVGASALGFVGRGFETLVSPALGLPLGKTQCISCGQCVTVCPTGALTEKLMVTKQLPLEEELTETTCSFCSVGCKTQLANKGSMLTRALPAGEEGLLCAKGRFAFGEFAKISRPNSPMMRKNGELTEPLDLNSAIVYANKNLQSLQSVHGRDCLAVAISERYTNEEAFLIKQYASRALGTDRVYSYGVAESGLGNVFGADRSTVTFEEMENTGLIVAVAAEGIVKPHGVAAMKIRRAVNRGAKLILLSSGESLLDGIATLNIGSAGSLDGLREVAKALLNCGGAEKIPGYDELARSLADVSPSEEAAAAAKLISDCPSAVFIFARGAVSVRGGELIANMALISGHHARPRSGVIQVLPGANSQGLYNLGVLPGSDLNAAIENGRVRGLFIFGDNAPGADIHKLDFLAVQDTHLTDTAEKADVFFPAPSPFESGGSFTAADGQLNILTPLEPQIFRGTPAAIPRVSQIVMLSAHAGAAVGNYPDYPDFLAAVRKAALADIPDSIGQPKLVPIGEGGLLRPPVPDAFALRTEFVKNLISQTIGRK